MNLLRFYTCVTKSRKIRTNYCLINIINVDNYIAGLLPDINKDFVKIIWIDRIADGHKRNC